MINGHISEIVYDGYDAELVENVNQYIFSYLYDSYVYVDSVIMADNYAKSISSNTSSAEYKNALWNKSKNFTIPLFKRASHAFADLIYTAWVQAGSPSIITNSSGDPVSISNAVLEPTIPNPFSQTTQVKYTIRESTKVLLQVRDVNGQVVKILKNDLLAAGKYDSEWTPADEPAGIYYLVLNTGTYIQVQKMIYSGK
jgi:hypothetical protein